MGDGCLLVGRGDHQFKCIDGDEIIYILRGIRLCKREVRIEKVSSYGITKILYS